MDRTELSKCIASQMPITQAQARQFVEVMLDIFEQELVENTSLTLRDFGTFTSGNRWKGRDGTRRTEYRLLYRHATV